jgi:hypothetical protein
MGSSVTLKPGRESIGQGTVVWYAGWDIFANSQIDCVAGVRTNPGETVSAGERVIRAVTEGEEAAVCDAVTLVVTADVDTALADAVTEAAALVDAVTEEAALLVADKVWAAVNEAVELSVPCRLAELESVVDIVGESVGAVDDDSLAVKVAERVLLTVRERVTSCDAAELRDWEADMLVVAEWLFVWETDLDG